MTAPCSTVLNGYTFTPLASTACSPTKHSSPSTTPSSPRTPPRRSQERPIGGAAEAHGLAEVGVVVDDDALEVGVGPDADVGAEHRVRAEAHAGLDAAVLADHGRADDGGVGVDLGPLPHVDAVAHLEAGDLDVHAAVEDVLVRRQVALEGADVLPVALGDGAEERLAGVEQGREHLRGEVDRLGRAR